MERLLNQKLDVEYNEEKEELELTVFGTNYAGDRVSQYFTIKKR